MNTGQEDFHEELDGIIKDIRTIFAAVPKGKKKAELEAYNKIAFIVSQAIATLGCMKNDYLIADLEDVVRQEKAFEELLEIIKNRANVYALAEQSEGIQVQKAASIRLAEIKAYLHAITLFTGRKINFDFDPYTHTYKIVENQFETTEKVICQSEK